MVFDCLTQLFDAVLGACQPLESEYAANVAVELPHQGIRAQAQRRLVGLVLDGHGDCLA
ncbi:Uncharacterised protein [Mycobacteroides abscessus subsp. abscessus]|nr:Uncharacterised protein [Mycobacteroides abscessus subsp. abscessus]SLD95184.1 Uncharacterised protein [Mycobacteroides abscessus subsp. massiliense]